MTTKKPLTNPVPAVDVSTLHVEHPRVCAQDWRSPLVRRLLRKPKYADGSTPLNDSFKAQDLKEVLGQFPLEWKGLKEDFDQRVNTYQEHTITEHATLGLACVLLTRHTEFRISEVCRRGESVDYWIGDANVTKRFVLEVGGLQTGSLEALSTEKTNQLRDNPWCRGGFICVAVFEDVAARLWFCAHGSTS